MSHLIDAETIRDLKDKAMFTLGWVLAQKEGIDNAPVYPLTKALLECGVDSSHLRNIAKHYENKLSVASPKIEMVKY